MKLYEKYGKRLFDIFVSIIFVIILLPVFLVISMAIIISSGPPVIYRQERIGKDRRKFKIYKFRTMINNADKLGTSTKENDDRITGIGRILRKTSLDELPQLINVIKGDMSIVGFRPDVWRPNDDITQKKWHTRPGITGYAQVNGRSNLTVEDAHKLEDEYASKLTLTNDIKTIFKTFLSIVKSEGTN